VPAVAVHVPDRQTELCLGNCGANHGSEGDSCKHEDEYERGSLQCTDWDSNGFLGIVFVMMLFAML